MNSDKQAQIKILFITGLGTLLVRYIFFTLLLLFCFCAAFSQKYHFRKYSLQDGLPQMTVNTMIQDSKGFLWIGTSGGASRFDGKNFKDFTTKEGIVNNRINDIVEDKFGNIWFATRAGITVFTASDPVQRFISITHANGLKSEAVSSLEPDGSKGVFIGTDKGLYYYKFDINQNPFTADSLSPYVTPVNYRDLGEASVRDIVLSNNNKLWIGTSQSLICFDPENGSQQLYTPEDGLSGIPVNVIKEGKDGNIWCGTLGGLTKISLSKEGVFESIETMEGIPTLQFKNVQSIHCNLDGTIWIGVHQLCFMEKDSTNSTGYRVTEVLKHQKGIHSNTIKCILQDREGNYWFGGGTNGIAMMGNRTFELYNHIFGGSGVSARAIIEDKNNAVWCGTNSGISYFKPDFDKARADANYKFIKKFKQKGNTVSSVWSMLYDTKGNIWAGGVNGVFKYDGDASFELFSERKEFVGKVAMRIYEDRGGRIWISTFSGVNVYEPETKKLYQPFNEGHLLYKERVTDFYEDKNNTLWVSSRYGLLSIKNRIHRLFTTDYGLPDNYILNICADKNQNLWLATGQGISMFNGTDFTNYSTHDGLSSDTPYLLILDDYGFLWMGTNKGLDRITLNDKSEITGIKHYGKSEGFLGLETNARAALKDSKGTLWFGTTEGLVKYNKELDQKNTVEPLVSITRMSINYNDTSMFKDLSLTYDQNHITFHYRALSLTAPEKVRYKFKLKGFDQEWSPETKETFTRYSNLPHGEYEFKVIACNNDKVWSQQPTSYKFTIEPPFWRTPWFYILCIALICGSVYSYILLKTRSLKRSKQVLELRVKERTKQLNEQKKRIESAYDEISTQKEEIEAQKDELENTNTILAEKNRNITDSILYAKRIQDSILPGRDSFKHYLKDAFIFYKPKDIVSGDFYFIEKTKKGNLIFSAADCTGHGVPGAMVSVMCANALTKAVKELGIYDPAKMLDKTAAILEEHFEKSKEEVRDGMDIALCKLSIANSKTRNWALEYAGANNPLWIIRNTESGPLTVEGKTLPSIDKGLKSLYELKPDKQPIGKIENRRPFTNYITKLKKGDAIYLFSDGFADQFGGPDLASRKGGGKKFKYKPFKQLLLSIQDNSMDEQQQIIDNAFEEWKGSLEQIDDVCIIGVRL